MREAAELGEEERRSLLVGQVAHIRHELAELGPLLDLFGQPRRRGLTVLQRQLAAGAQHRQAAIARDRE